jgi:hypothetical protein
MSKLNFLGKNQNFFYYRFAQQQENQCSEFYVYFFEKIRAKDA